jgi:hypothetical protein
MILTCKNQRRKRKYWTSAISSVTNPTCVMYWPGTESRCHQLRDLQLTVWAVKRLPVNADRSEVSAVFHRRSHSKTVFRSSGEKRILELSKATWLFPTLFHLSLNLKQTLHLQIIPQRRCNAFLSQKLKNWLSFLWEWQRHVHLLCGKTWSFLSVKAVTMLYTQTALF